jgi:hypothetical protein
MKHWLHVPSLPPPPSPCRLEAVVDASEMIDMELSLLLLQLLHPFALIDDASLDARSCMANIELLLLAGHVHALPMMPITRIRRGQSNPHCYDGQQSDDLCVTYTTGHESLRQGFPATFESCDPTCCVLDP